MIGEAKPFILYAVSSIHAGSGSDVGIVDLPIQREKHTNYPKIESSSLKGAIRAAVSHATGALSGNESMKEKIKYVFGIDPEEAREGKSQAGAISFADARLLLFPVKSMRSVFAWVTCPDVLKRFNREMQFFKGGVNIPIPEADTVASDGLTVTDGQIVLEEYTFSVRQTEETVALAAALQEIVFPHGEHDLAKRLVVLNDDAYRDFVTLSTEVNARVSIDPDTGTASGRALWYEENMPPESVFYSFLFAGHVRGKGTNGIQSQADVLAFMENSGHFPEVFQLGGNTTLGHGMLRRTWIESGDMK